MSVDSMSSLLFSVALLVLVVLPIFPFAGGSITVDLIHRDSPLSPFYDSSATHHDRVLAACVRSQTRRQMLMNNSFSSKRSIRSHVLSYAFEFLMKVNVGTPPVTLFLIADTGSDLVWTKSMPCTKCSNKGRYITYDPKISSSYRPVRCNSSACASAYPNAVGSCGRNNSCPFALLYGDGSQSDGELGLETMGLGSNVLPNIIFGLSHTLQGSFQGSGIVGLGSSPVSLIRQVGSLIGGAKFSYCLAKDKSTGKISFGHKSIPMGSKVVSTPMVFLEPYTYYYLTINSFSVGANGKRIQFGVDREKGNIIIDSGTTLTLLPIKVYKEIEKSFTQQIKAKPIPDPTETLNLCYETNNVDKFPPMTVYFDGGAEVVLPPTNTFVSTVEGVFCLAISPIQADEINIYGNIWQENMFVGYDLEKKQVHFKPGGCVY